MWEGVGGRVPCGAGGTGTGNTCQRDIAGGDFCESLQTKVQDGKAVPWPSDQSQPSTFASPMKCAGLPTDSDRFSTGTFYRRDP